MYTTEHVRASLQLAPTSLPGKAASQAADHLSVFQNKAIPPNYGSLIEILTMSSTYRNLQQAFLKVTGLALSFRPVESIQLPQAGQGKASAFCALMADNRRRASPAVLTG